MIMPLTNFTSYKSDFLNKNNIGTGTIGSTNTNMNTYGSTGKYEGLLQAKSNTLDSNSNSNANTLLGIIRNITNRSKIW